jgi:hypothetical protein
VVSGLLSAVSVAAAASIAISSSAPVGYGTCSGGDWSNLTAHASAFYRCMGSSLLLRGSEGRGSSGTG